MEETKQQFDNICLKKGKNLTGVGWIQNKGDIIFLLKCSSVLFSENKIFLIFSINFIKKIFPIFVSYSAIFQVIS